MPLSKIAVKAAFKTVPKHAQRWKLQHALERTINIKCLFSLCSLHRVAPSSLGTKGGYIWASWLVGEGGGGGDLEEIGRQEDAVDEAKDQEEGQHVEDRGIEGHEESQAGQYGGDEHHAAADRAQLREERILRDSFSRPSGLCCTRPQPVKVGR